MFSYFTSSAVPHVSNLEASALTDGYAELETAEVVGAEKLTALLRPDVASLERWLDMNA